MLKYPQIALFGKDMIMYDQNLKNRPYETSFEITLPNGERETLSALVTDPDPYFGPNTIITAYVPDNLLAWSKPDQLQRRGYKRNQKRECWSLSRLGENESHALDLLRRDLEDFLNLQQH